MEENNQFKIFAGSKGLALAQGICDELGCQLGNVHVDHFSDGEFCTYFEESVRGQSVYLVQPTCANSDNLMELLLMIDAAKRASAAKVIAVIPYFGWARQDRKDKPRVSIGAKLVANMLQTAGADRVITVDLHADQIQGFFDIPVDHIYGSNVLAPYVAGLNLKKLIVASPDVGGSKRASNFAKKLHTIIDRNVPMVICYKYRPEFNQVSEIRVLGDVYGKDVVLFDDIAQAKETFASIRKEALGIKTACDTMNGTIESLTAISKENARTAEVTAASVTEMSRIIGDVTGRAENIKDLSNDLGGKVSSYRT